MIALSAGHYPDAQGAGCDDVYEHPMAFGWVAMIKAHFKNVTLVPTGTLQEKVRFINQLNPDLAVEIHFNSDPKRAGHGCETLFCPGSTRGRSAAEFIHPFMSDVCQPDRGIKEGWYRMDRPGVIDYDGDTEGDERPDYFLRETNCPALILEPGFIHDYQELSLIQLPACWAIAKGLERYEASERFYNQPD